MSGGQVISDRNIVFLSGVIRLHSYLGRKIVQTPGLSHCPTLQSRPTVLCLGLTCTPHHHSSLWEKSSGRPWRSSPPENPWKHQRTDREIKWQIERDKQREGLKTWQSNLCRRQAAHLSLFFSLTTKMNIEQIFKSFTTLIKFYLGQAGPNDLWDKSKHLEINC